MLCPRQGSKIDHPPGGGPGPRPRICFSTGNLPLTGPKIGPLSKPKLMPEANTENKDDLLKSMDLLLEAQERNNQARYRELRSLATPGFLKVFDLAPTLLHYNHPDLPGYLDHPGTPSGVVAYSGW